MPCHNLLHAQYSQKLPLWRTLILSTGSLLMLSACGGPDGGTITTSGPNANAAAALPPAEISRPAAAQQDAVKTNAASDSAATLETVAPIPTPMETFRALAPQQGLKITPLFKEPVADESARIKRVEDAVQGLHNDFETIMPTMVRMASMEKDMRGLIDKLHTLTGTSQAAAPAAEKPNEAEGEPMVLTQDPEAPATGTDIAPSGWPDLDDVETAAMPAKAAKTASPAPKTDNIAEVKAIRIADHTDSTRIVLDMSAKATIPPASFQNDNKQLVLDLPQIHWNAKTEAALKNSSLVSGYKYADGKLILLLTRAAEIKGQQSLPPEGASGHRLVLDLKSKA